MQRRHWALLGLFCLLAPLAGRMCRAADSRPETADRGKFLRLERNDQGQLLGLQTAVVHYTPSDAAKRDLQVDLIGAVHVGERAYYDALNELFKKYDVVLYELVAPAGTRIPKGAKPGAHPVAMLQNGLKDMLALEHQLTRIDYTQPNLVHADMSPDEVTKSMNNRGESVVSMMFRMMGHGIAQQTRLEAQGKAPQADLFGAFFSRDRSGAMKRMFAEQFEILEDMMQALEGPEGSTLITERNKVALAKMAEQIAAGKKKVAIFYGAGHLGDMEKHLLADFQLKRDGEEWLTAWSLDKSPAKTDDKSSK